MTEARYYHLPRRGDPVLLNTLEEALTTISKGGFVWLDYRQPTRDDLAVLMAPLGLHPLAIENCVDERQIPKLSEFQTHLFVLLNSFHYRQRQLDIQEVDAFLGDTFLVTVSGCNALGQPVLPEAEAFVAAGQDAIRQGPAFLLHALLDGLVEETFAAIEAIEDDLDSTEEPILTAPSRFSPAELLHLRRDLLALRKGLYHEREMVAKLSRKDYPFVPDKALVFYRDLSDRLVRSLELTESSRELANSLMEMYLSVLNNEMNRLANQTNRTMRRLTLISTICMPLGLLAGVLGMSEWTMMTGPENWRLAYPAFLLSMVAIGVANYLWLKRLERRG